MKKYVHYSPLLIIQYNFIKKNEEEKNNKKVYITLVTPPFKCLGIICKANLCYWQ